MVSWSVSSMYALPSFIILRANCKKEEGGRDEGGWEIGCMGCEREEEMRKGNRVWEREDIWCRIERER